MFHVFQAEQGIQDLLIDDRLAGLEEGIEARPVEVMNFSADSLHEIGGTV